MKKYTLLGHVFEFEDNAYHFFVRYIERIEEYATSHSVGGEVMTDIKYSIIEKLYRYETPITEKQTIELANALGEPEVIFGESEETEGESEHKFKRTFAIDKEKPMIRGVCYWLAKSMNVSVRIMRIIFIVLALINGAGLVLYVILALFVPFKDKKKTTGVIGNILFELVRIAFWLAIISAVLPMTVAAIVGTGFLFFTPAMDNQSLTAWVPQYMYIVGILMSAALLMFSIGSIGALFKQRWINKALGILATIVLLGGLVVTAGTIYKTVMLVSSHQTTVEQFAAFSGSTVSGDRINIDLTKVNNNTEAWDIGLGNADVKIVRTTGTDIKVHITTTMRGLSDEALKDVASKLQPLVITGDANNVIISRDGKLFSSVVPLAGVQRHIEIAIPEGKEVYINKDRRVNMSVQSHLTEFDENGRRLRVGYCEAQIYVYNPSEDAFTCKDVVRDDSEYRSTVKDEIQEQVDDAMKDANEGLDRVPPMYPQD